MCCSQTFTCGIRNRSYICCIRSQYCICCSHIRNCRSCSRSFLPRQRKQYAPLPGQPSLQRMTGCTGYWRRILPYIPASINCSYGSRSRRVYLYVHGKNGCKEEAERFAGTACAAGWQVLAIDLPEHGARKNSPEQLLPWVAVPEIEAVYARMKPVWAHIRLYGVSIGAWLAMQALQGDAPEQALLASPVVDMEALITNMMQYAHVTEEQLQRAGEIPTDLGETLSWPYLCWVREHPLHWHGRTQVLYGDRDALTSRTLIERFRQESGAHLTIMEGGEHWFHTPVQMAAVQMWEEANL